MKSAAAMLLNKTDREVRHCGKVYFNKGKVTTVHQDDQHIKAGA